jgi:vancomycin resistance protein YoaR
VAKKKKQETAPPLKDSFLKGKIFWATFSITIMVLLLALIPLVLSQRFYPGVSIASVPVSFLDRQTAADKVQTIINNRMQQISFTYQQASKSAETDRYTIDLSKVTPSLDINKSIDHAYLYGHTTPFLPPKDVSLTIDLNNSNLDQQINDIRKQVDVTPLDSSIKIDNDQIVVTESKEGREIDQDALKDIISDYLNTGHLSQTTLPIKASYPKISYDTALQIKKKLDEIKLSPLKLVYKDQTFTMDLTKVLNLIDFNSTQNSLISLSLPNREINITNISSTSTDIGDTRLKVNEENVRSYLTDIASQIDQQMQEPLFNLDQSTGKPKIIEFKPPVEGRTLLIDQAIAEISQNLAQPGQNIIQLPVQSIQPKTKLTNDLGIKELIGRGVSNFAGSIPNRIYNVNLTAEKINGTLIAPGDVFSFDNTVGDITAANGFKQAYVIKNGRTVLDDGGGVCQDSTTLFRAALNAGLPIVERTAHAYRVGYYEQGFPPGLDATIFYPSVDFKFKNDTPSYILIQTYVEGTTLTIDLYGTSDGRVSTVSKPVITSQTPAPPELRQDDPTLPKGTVKQVDFAAAGANVVFNRTVTRNGQTLISETFRSNYRPWQAVYLVGTGG